MDRREEKAVQFRSEKEQGIMGSRKLTRNSPMWRLLTDRLNHCLGPGWRRGAAVAWVARDSEGLAWQSWLLRIKFEAVDCLLLRMKCETAIS